MAFFLLLMKGDVCCFIEKKICGVGEIIFLDAVAMVDPVCRSPKSYAIFFVPAQKNWPLTQAVHIFQVTLSISMWPMCLCG